MKSSLKKTIYASAGTLMLVGVIFLLIASFLGKTEEIVSLKREIVFRDGIIVNLEARLEAEQNVAKGYRVLFQLAEEYIDKPKKEKSLEYIFEYVETTSEIKEKVEGWERQLEELSTESN